jgi:hypothetical protein
MIVPFVHVVKPVLKSPALLPVIVGVFVRVTEDDVPFVRVAVIEDVNPPIVVDGKVTGFGENARMVLPVPVRFTLIGLPDGPVNGILSWAARAPARVGWNVTKIEQLPPSAASVPQLGGPNEKLKSPGFVPPNAIAPVTNGVVVLFVSVNDWKVLGAPTATAPKSKLVGEIVTPPAVAVPLTLMLFEDVGLFPLLLLIFTVANKKPVSIGEKARFNVHVLPGPGKGGTTTPFVQVVPAAIVKSAAFVEPIEIFEIVSGPLPVFVSVTVFAALVMPTGCGLVKFTKVVERTSFGVSTPFPVNVTF